MKFDPQEAERMADDFQQAADWYAEQSLDEDDDPPRAHSLAEDARLHAEWAAMLRAAVERVQELEGREVVWREMEQRHADALNRLAAAEKVVEAAREVAGGGVVFEDERVDYVEVQIDREAWPALAQALQEYDKGGSNG